MQIKRTIQKTIVAAAVLLILYFMIGSPVVAWHNKKLRDAIRSVAAEKKHVTLNEIVPFSWDKVYTFPPYTTEKEMEKRIGFHSRLIEEAGNEGMEQLIFVKGNHVTASICGYAENLGYGVTFQDCITFREKAVFAVERSPGIIRLRHM